MFVFGFLGHAQVHPAVKGLMLAWQQMEPPHMAARLWQMIGAKIFLVIFVDGVPLLEWAHGERMVGACWAHIRHMVIHYGHCSHN